MSEQPQVNSGSSNNHHLPALTGVRFFAVFHIYLFHLFIWFWMPKPEGMENVLSGLEAAPDAIKLFASNGWMSTSFFFLLSGFILAYLYWGEDGRMVSTRRRFWLTRAARIYPIHLIVLSITMIAWVPIHLSDGMSLGLMISSAIGTATLVQAWVPPWVPVWSWPTWTISALMFLYLIMPWLMDVLGRLNRKQMIIALAAMPVVSILPTIAYSVYLGTGGQWSQNLDIVIANNPLLWTPYFAAGMLMTKVFSISRFKPMEVKPSWFSWGDAAIIVIVALAISVYIEQPWKFFLRQGVLMPLLMVILLDLARGRGLFARLFSLPGTGFLGETSFSMFIWQNFIVLLLYASITQMPNIGPYQHWPAIGLLVVLAIISTYLIEKPIARWIRRKYIDA